MTYQELCAFEVLYDAYLEARKRKRKKPATAQYEANVLAYTDRLSHILEAKTYRPGKFETFYVFEPKKRLVQAPAQDHRLAVRPAAPPVETAAAEPTPEPAGGPRPGRQAGRDTPVGITT